MIPPRINAASTTAALRNDRAQRARRCANAATSFVDSTASSVHAFRTVEIRRNVETIIRRWRGSQLLRCGLGRIQGQLRIGGFCSPLPDQVGAEINAFVADERGSRSSADENE